MSDEHAERYAEAIRDSELLRQGLWDAWVALGHDTDGDKGPGALIAGMGVDGFIGMVVRDATTWRRESESDYDADTDALEARARAAEAKVARVEAVTDEWEGLAGDHLRRGSCHHEYAAQRRYLMARVDEVRDALDGGA